MFTGIIESVGEVLRLSKGESLLELAIKNPIEFQDLSAGKSLSVNGVCLTVLDLSLQKGSQLLTFEVSGETISKTNIGQLKIGDKVNLERALPAEGRFDGHIVLGHIDMFAKIKSVSSNSKGESIFEFEFEKSFGKFFVEKGAL